MNPLDKLVGFFNPEAGLKRARARAALRIYDGAQFGRRSTAWRSRGASANAELQQGLRPLRDRARDLARNSPYIPRAMDIFVAHAVGTGLKPMPRTGSDRLDTKVHKLWEEWQASADVEGDLSFYADQALALRSTIESGEVVVRFVDKPLGRKREDRVPLKLQVLEADFIDQAREGVYSVDEALGVTPDTKRSRLGVGLGEDDYRTGIWLFPFHPGEITTYNLRPGISRFHPREEIIHLYRKLRPGQVRGVTWFAPVLMTARDLADLMDALVVKWRVEACFAGFVTNSDDYESLLDPSATGYGQGGQYDMVNPDAQVTTLEPGMLKELRAGQDIKFAQPTQTAQIEPAFMIPLMAMAAGIGVTYDQITGDLRGANYSSLRAGKIDFRKLVEELQDLVIKPRLCQRVWDRFISRTILVGELNERSRGYPCDWVAPAWAQVNPKFDADAEKREVRAGRLSPQEYIAEYGSDWRKVQDDTAEFYERADALGLVFDIDPRKVSQLGKTQGAPKAGAAGAEKGNGAANGADGDAGDSADGDQAELLDKLSELDADELSDLIDAATEARSLRETSGHVQ